MTITIYHNPRCSKSRQTLALLEQHAITPEIIDYQKQPLSEGDIKQLVSLLELDTARSMMRTKEDIYKQLALNTQQSEDKLIAAMAEHPKLIERPIVVNGNKAAIGRPPENILPIIK
jgi:arsenate reductase